MKRAMASFVTTKYQKKKFLEFSRNFGISDDCRCLFDLEAHDDTQGPRVLDLGAIAVLEELAGAVTAVDAQLIPR